MAMLNKIAKMKPYRRPTWFDKLSTSQQKELSEVKKMFLNGTLKDASGCMPSVRSLWGLAKSEGIEVCVRSFQDWLQHEPKGQD